MHREKTLLDNIQFPGINRYMMPEVPERSEPLRKAQKSQIYPFITTTVFEFERR